MQFALWEPRAPVLQEDEHCRRVTLRRERGRGRGFRGADNGGIRSFVTLVGLTVVCDATRLSASFVTHVGHTAVCDATPSSLIPPSRLPSSDNLVG